MNKTTTLSTLATILLAAAAPGCLGQTADDASHDQEHPSSEGLALERNAPERAEGRFTHEGAEVHFVVARDDGSRTIAVRAKSGATLLESTIKDDVSTERVLERLVITTPRRGEPSREGDAAALDELLAMPEAAAIRGLARALDEAHVAAAEAPAPPRAGVAPQGYVSPGSYSAMTYLAPGDYTVTGTTPFWFGTYVYVRAGWRDGSSNSGCVTLQGGAGYPYPLCASGLYPTVYKGYWWGLPLTIRTNNYMRVEVM